MLYFYYYLTKSCFYFCSPLLKHTLLLKLKHFLTKNLFQQISKRECFMKDIQITIIFTFQLLTPQQNKKKLRRKKKVLFQDNISTNLIFHVEQNISKRVMQLHQSSVELPIHSMKNCQEQLLFDQKSINIYSKTILKIIQQILSQPKYKNISEEQNHQQISVKLQTLQSQLRQKLNIYINQLQESYKVEQAKRVSQYKRRVKSNAYKLKLKYRNKMAKLKDICKSSQEQINEKDKKVKQQSTDLIQKITSLQKIQNKVNILNLSQVQVARINNFIINQIQNNKIIEKIKKFFVGEDSYLFSSKSQEYFKQLAEFIEKIAELSSIQNVGNDMYNLRIEKQAKLSNATYFLNKVSDNFVDIAKNQKQLNKSNEDKKIILQLINKQFSFSEIRRKEMDFVEEIKERVQLIKRKHQQQKGNILQNLKELQRKVEQNALKQNGVQKKQADKLLIQRNNLIERLNQHIKNLQQRLQFLQKSIQNEKQRYQIQEKEKLQLRQKLKNYKRAQQLQNQQGSQKIQGQQQGSFSWSQVKIAKIQPSLNQNILVKSSTKSEKQEDKIEIDLKEKNLNQVNKISENVQKENCINSQQKDQRCFIRYQCEQKAQYEIRRPMKNEQIKYVSQIAQLYTEKTKIFLENYRYQQEHQSSTLQLKILLQQERRKFIIVEDDLRKKEIQFKKLQKQLQLIKTKAETDKENFNRWNQTLRLQKVALKEQIKQLEIQIKSKIEQMRIQRQKRNQ